MKARRIATTAIVFVWLTFLVTAQFVVGDFAGTYRIHLRRPGGNAELPLALQYVGLPLLGHGSLSVERENWLWYLARVVAFAPPILILLLAWRTPDPRTLDTAWLYGALAYIALMANVLILLVGTLWLPWKCC